MTETQVLARLSAAIEKAGSMRKWATANGVSAAYVSDVLRGNRELGEKILSPLRIEKTVRTSRIVTYREKK